MHTKFADFGAILSRHATARPEAIAIKEGEMTWRYGDVQRYTNALIRLLRSIGVHRHEVVALMVPNSGAFVVAFFAISDSGCVVAPFNIRYQQQELRYYIEDTMPAAIIISPELRSTVAAAMEGIAQPPAILTVDNDGHAHILNAPNRATGGTTGPFDPGKDYLLLQYTSGSTGAPKRIYRTHEQLLLELEQLQSAFELEPSDRFIGVAPFSHVNGLVRTMMASMYVGGTLYPMASFDRRRALDIITNERITYFGGVPYMFVLLADTPMRGQVDLSSIRVAFSASAPLLEPDNRRFCAKYGIAVRQLYGSTETGTISVNLGGDPLERPESVGTPLSGVLIEVIDDRGLELPANQEGEVVISSPWAITAYEGNERATEEAFVDGKYRSGDLGILDQENYLQLTGRKKFMINRGGFKVNPLEVEKAILSMDKVSEAVVVGQVSRFGDESVRAVVVAGETCDPDEIIEHCRARIADYKVPSVIEFRDELPKSQTGKILR
ncbi:MAG: acyl--CoA ligase, partial [Gammaproteobacteria bacterium]|nr:acyl--CoA ligase [Gammaproteobacteria bacterium]